MVLQIQLNSAHSFENVRIWHHANIETSLDNIKNVTSSDETIAKVTDGNIQAVKPGQAIITVSVKDEKDVKATITVTVTKKIIYEVNIENKNITLVEGSELNTTLKWENSDDTVISVTDGKVKALKEGVSTVKISIVDHPEGYVRVNVTVIKKITVNM